MLPPLREACLETFVKNICKKIHQTNIRDTVFPNPYRPGRAGAQSIEGKSAYKH